jgi:hypothetical protein
MKQGRATHSNTASTKVEPKSRAVSVEAVSEIGIHQVREKSISLYEGRGLEAPMAGCTNHKSGSQGKH